MSASDPFYAVRDALEAEVQSLKVKFDDWQGQLHSVNTASDTKFRVKHEGECRAAVMVRPRPTARALPTLNPSRLPTTLPRPLL